MAYKQMFIWVEGADDVRFFDSTFRRAATGHFHSVKIIPYATMKKQKVNAYIKSIRSMNAEYLVIGDRDQRTVEEAKADLVRKFTEVELDRVIIVGTEIESWYIAGLTTEFATMHKIMLPANTNEVTKEQFDQLVPRSFSSRVHWMTEILGQFSAHKARTRNTTFDDFSSKHICGVIS
jgi:hypothetical protein